MASQSPAVTRVSGLALIVTKRGEFSRESFLSLDNPGTLEAERNRFFAGGLVCVVS